MLKAGRYLLAGGAVCFFLIGCKEPDTLENRFANTCSERGKKSAWENSKKFVLDRLKAPATAEFGPFDDPDTTVFQEKDNPCGFVVRGNVDAQNAYGAKLRSRYAVIVNYHIKDGSWGSDATYINGR